MARGCWSWRRRTGEEEGGRGRLRRMGGRWSGEDYTLAVAVRAVLGGKREKGNGKRVVVCNLSTSLVVEDAARDCDAEVVRTPVGEVHVARAILRLAAVIGGEGNGGVMYPA